jgi:DNA repair protein RecN (Recombination protein N)
MLRELHIQNLAVIEDATIDLRPGLNCFTGQTGAGKSLVIGALEVLLGLRSAGQLLRSGADEGRVSGVFELADPQMIQHIASLADVPLEDHPASASPATLLITRKLFSSGRTSYTVNGSPATIGMVRAIAEVLVDVHGQHEHQCLLKPANQLLLLDQFAHLLPQRQAFADLHARLTDLTTRRAELSASETLRRQQLDLYEFQAQEIDAAEPTAGEYEELAARNRLLSNLEKVCRQATAAHAALYESEGAILERLSAVVGLLRELTEYDEELAPAAQSVKEGLAQLQDAAFDLSRYLNRLELDPAELAQVTERLNLLNRLIHKYGDLTPASAGTLADVIHHRRHIQSEIDRLRAQSHDLATIDQQIAPLRTELHRIGRQLTADRQAAAARLKPLIEKQLAELGMAEALITFDFNPAATDDANAAPSSPASAASGLDIVEIMLQPNPGQPARPLRKIASGGELSRIMLAIKSIVAGRDRLSVLVFDEIDSNVGGRMGTVIGDKLRRIASSHQVLCITHLPQIAAYADHHLHIAKQVAAGQTRTIITALTDRDRRIDELSEMLTGANPTPTTRRQATELLDDAQRPPSTASAASTASPDRRSARPGRTSKRAAVPA